MSTSTQNINQVSTEVKSSKPTWEDIEKAMDSQQVEIGIARWQARFSDQCAASGRQRGAFANHDASGQTGEFEREHLCIVEAVAGA